MNIENRPGVIVIEGHVQGLANTRALGELGIPVFVVDKYNCIARYSKHCQKYLRSPDYLSDSFIEFLLKIGYDFNLNGWILYPSNDHAVYNISKNKSALSRYYNIITPELSIIDNFYNKKKLLTLAEGLGLPIPKTIYPKDISLESTKFPFPVLTKGKFGLTFYKRLGKKAYLAESKLELKQQYEEIRNKLSLDDVFTQELIPFDEHCKTISFTDFCIDGEIKTHWIGAKIREHPHRFGTATSCRSISEPILREISRPLLKTLQYTGVCEVEFLKDPRDNQYKLIEINSRTWLWVELAKRCGVNFPLMIYNYLNNIENIYPSTYTTEKEWIHFTTDLPYSLKGIFEGKYRINDIMRSYLGKPAPAVFNKSDFVPSLAELFLIPSFILRR